MDNEIFESLADLFANDETVGDLHLGSALRCGELDYSIHSLRAVDQFLDTVRETPGTDHDILMTVLRAGSYVGEVMRRASPRRIYWSTFENASPRSQIVRQFGKQPSTLGVLIHGQAVSFPLGKIVKSLHFGREDSVRAFAESVVMAHAR